MGRADRDVPSARLTAVVSGRVQGVGFRAWVREQAQRLGLGGSATNRTDGTVEVIAEGPRRQLEQLLDVLRSGQAPGDVRSVTPEWSSATGSPARFVER